MPTFVGEVVNLLQAEEFEKIGPLCLILLAVNLVAGACGFARSAIFNIMSDRIARNLRHDFYENMIRKDIGFYDDQRTGDLISRLNSDI